MQLVSGVLRTALLAIGVSVGAIILVIVFGIRALRRPLDEANYRSALWESRLNGTLAALAALLLGVTLIGLVVWLIAGVFGGMST